MSSIEYSYKCNRNGTLLYAVAYEQLCEQSETGNNITYVIHGMGTIAGDDINNLMIAGTGYAQEEYCLLRLHSERMPELLSFQEIGELGGYQVLSFPCIGHDLEDIVVDPHSDGPNEYEDTLIFGDEENAFEKCSRLMRDVLFEVDLDEIRLSSYALETYGICYQSPGFDTRIMRVTCFQNLVEPD